MEFLVLWIFILRRVKDKVSGQSIASDNNLRKIFESKNKQRTTSGVRLRKFKTLSHGPRSMDVKFKRFFFATILLHWNVERRWI